MLAALTLRIRSRRERLQTTARIRSYARGGDEFIPIPLRRAR